MRLRPHHHPPAGKINVTPLIDVVMVLIVFYLIVGKLAADARAKVQLPGARVGVTDNAAADLTITLQADPNSSVIFVGDERCTIADLPAILRARGINQPGRSVQLRADKALDYSKVSPVIAACREAGVPSLKLIAQREDPGAR